MSSLSLNKLWAFIESLALSQKDRNWLAGKLLEPNFHVDPYEVSPLGDAFFADSRNVEAVEKDIAAAHQAEAAFTRLECKEDVLALMESL